VHEDGKGFVSLTWQIQTLHWSQRLLWPYFKSLSLLLFKCVPVVCRLESKQHLFIINVLLPTHFDYINVDCSCFWQLCTLVFTGNGRLKSSLQVSPQKWQKCSLTWFIFFGMLKSRFPDEAFTLNSWIHLLSDPTPCVCVCVCVCARAPLWNLKASFSTVTCFLVPQFKIWYFFRWHFCQFWCPLVPVCAFKQ